MIEYSAMKSSEGAAFWEALGPFFASREVAKELGGPVYDDARFEWVVAKEGGVVVGWAALVRKPDRVDLDWAYVIPAQRGKGIYRELFRRRLERIGEDSSIRGMTRNPIAQQVYVEFGFVEAGNRGSWKQYRRYKSPIGGAS